MIKFIVSGVVAVLVVLLAATVVFANTLTESSDAGDLPGTAQVAAGTEVLTLITGDLNGDNDVDMYQICLEGGGNFSAASPEEDPDGQLFLFNKDGIGVFGNDDTFDKSPFPDGFNPTLPAGGLSPTAPGIYYLAYSSFNEDPISLFGNIFPPTPGPNADVVYGPTGPGGGSPITGWNGLGEGAEEGTGDYTINLTGAFGVDACRTAVGGTTSFLTGSGSSSGSIALLTSGVAAVVAIAAGGWYTRKRLLGS